MKIFGSAAHVSYGIRTRSEAKSTSPAAVITPAASAVEISPALQKGTAIPKHLPIQDNREVAGNQKPTLVSSPIASPILPVSADPPAVSTPSADEPVVSEPIVSGSIAPIKPVLVSGPIFSLVSIDLTA